MLNADVNIGGRVTLMAILETAIFDCFFYKKQYLSNGRLIVVKFHTNIANRWLFMIHRKIMVIILYS